MRGTVSRESTFGGGESGAHQTTIDDWRAYCQAVAMAAAQLRQIALSAEGEASLAADDGDPMRSIARDIGLLAPSNPKVRTYAAMMLGPFAALEELRRQIKQ